MTISPISRCLMPNKNLNDLDRIIRETCPVGMDDGVHCTIELFSGFELFIYRVKGKGVEVSREDLDDAVREWASLVKGKNASR